MEAESSPRPRHGHPAHPPPVRRHNEPTILHITICTDPRRAILDNEWVCNALVRGWKEARHWEVGEYMVMPDHVHFFSRPGIWEYPGIRRWAGFWKRKVGEGERRLRGVFQEDCWDTQMRTREHFEEKLYYMRQNPVRRGLVPTWEEWPYRGKVFDVHWL